MPAVIDPNLVAERLSHVGPVLAVNVAMIRDMMKHRGINAKALAKEAGMSEGSVQALTTGRFGKTWTESNALAQLERIESAITAISDREGGIPEMCCGVEGLEHTILAIYYGRYQGE